jgi:hypothetical protein
MTLAKDKVWYLAGPMSGIAQFNIPAFDVAASVLRDVYKLKIVSPVEMDNWKIRRACLLSPDGAMTPATLGGGTWADFLARDVKVIADKCDGIILMNDWTTSRGARLEAFVGLLTGKEFARYRDPDHVHLVDADTIRGYLRSNMP